MKKMFCLLVISAILCACLPAAFAAGEGLKDVRCDEWHFSARIPEGIHVSPVSFTDWDTDSGLCTEQGDDGPAEHEEVLQLWREIRIRTVREIRKIREVRALRKI